LTGVTIGGGIISESLLSLTMLNDVNTAQTRIREERSETFISMKLLFGFGMGLFTLFHSIVEPLIAI
jgi:hypothetical protein